MKIVIATGMYPPAIGGTATYAHELGHALREKGNEVTVVTYGEIENGKLKMENDELIRVSKSGNFFIRWNRYAHVLREIAHDADAVIVLSSISVGMPLRMARLQRPKKILRLGGDFFWERYTDAGGKNSLSEWYASRFGFWRMINTFLMGKVLRSFDRLVYSTSMQSELHSKHYASLPPSSVLENAMPKNETRTHALRSPMRLLCMSRFVGFKNLFALLDAARSLSDVRLTMVGSGPMRDALHAKADQLGLAVDWRGPASVRKDEIFAEHDLLIIPSVTEISPNTALEARSFGLPVLLSEETGLSESLRQGMVVAPLRTAEDIVRAITDVRSQYDQIARAAASPPVDRPWSHVAGDWISLLSSL